MRVALSIAVAGALFVPAIASAQSLGGQAGASLGTGAGAPIVTQGGMTSANLDGTLRSDALDRIPDSVRTTADRSARATRRTTAREKAYDARKRTTHAARPKH